MKLPKVDACFRQSVNTRAGWGSSGVLLLRNPRKSTREVAWRDDAFHAAPILASGLKEHICFRFVPLLFGVLVLAGCKRDSEEEPDEHGHDGGTVDLRLAFQFNHGTHDYELASEYTDDFSHVYKLDHIRFLLSELHVVDDDAATLATYPDVRLLIDASQPANEFDLGSLTADHAHQVRFTMGLPAGLNQAQPDTSAPPRDDATMQWGTAANEGYWFLVLEGRVDSDTSGAVDGNDATFSYRCATLLDPVHRRAPTC